MIYLIFRAKYDLFVPSLADGEEKREGIVLRISIKDTYLGKI